MTSSSCCGNKPMPPKPPPRDTKANTVEGISPLTKEAVSMEEETRNYQLLAAKAKGLKWYARCCGLSAFDVATINTRLNLGRFLRNLERITAQYGVCTDNSDEDHIHQCVGMMIDRLKYLDRYTKHTCDQLLRRSRRCSNFGFMYTRLNEQYLCWLEAVFAILDKSAERNGATVYLAFTDVLIPMALRFCQWV